MDTHSSNPSLLNLHLLISLLLILELLDLHSESPLNTIFPPVQHNCMCCVPSKQALGTYFHFRKTPFKIEMYRGHLFLLYHWYLSWIPGKFWAWISVGIDRIVKQLVLASSGWACSYLSDIQWYIKKSFSSIPSFLKVVFWYQLSETFLRCADFQIVQSAILTFSLFETSSSTLRWYLSSSIK